MRIAIAIFISVFLAACGSRPITYNPIPVNNLDEAKSFIEEATWSQHETWRPEELEITDQYISWSAHIQLKGRAGSGTAKHIADRFYYRSIDNVQLISWKRKMKQWYVVRITKKDRTKKNVLRTRSLETAQRYIDSLSGIIHIETTTP